MSWMESVIAALSPDDAVPLDRLVELQGLLDRHGLPDGTDHILSLLRRYYRDGLPSAEALQKMLARLEIDGDGRSIVARLVSFYGRLEEELGREQLALMTLPLSAVYAQDPLPLNVPLKRAFDVPLPRRASAVNLKLGLDVAAAITVDPRPDGAQAASQVAPGRHPVLVDMHGQLGVNTALNLPVQPVLFKGSAAGRVAVSLAYRYLNRTELSWGRVLVDNAARLRHTPFDIHDIARQLEDSELESILFDVEGSLALGGSIAVATPMGLIRHVDDVVSAGVGFRKDYKGKYRFRIDADPEQNGYVRLRIERERVDTVQTTASGGISMDLTALFERVRPAILAHLGSAQALVERILVFAEPGTFLREKAATWVESHDTEAWFNDLALSLITYDPSRQPSDVIGELLQKRFQTTGTKWAASADAMKDDLVGDLRNRLNLSDSIADKLQGWIGDAVSGFFEKANDELTSFIGDDDNYARLVDAWDEIGRHIDAELEDLDARTANLRELLQRTQERIGKAMLLIEQATEVRLSAQLAATTTTTRGADSDLALRFKRPGARARKVPDAWQRALTGDVASVIAEDAGNTPGADIQVIGGRLARFRQYRRGLDFEAVLMDFRLGGSSILESSVRIESDPWGNVQVVSSSATASDSARWLTTKRKLQLVEAHRLVLLDQVGGIGINTAFNHAEERLESDEIGDVLELFRDRGLISAQSVQEAQQYWNASPAEAKQGELVLRLDLGVDEVSALLHLDRSIVDFLDIARRTAANELGWAFGAHFLGKHNPRALLEFLEANGFAGNWPDILYGSDKARLQATARSIDDQEDLPAGFSTTYGLEGAIGAVQYCVDMLADLTGALRIMREIQALGSESLPDWDEQTWEDELGRRQDRIADHMKSWVTVSLGHTLFRKVRPQTVALFRTLAILAGKTPRQGHDLLSISINSPARGMKVIRRSA